MGPHRSAIAEGLASCADYVGRLQRSLASEAAPDRHYFSMRARALYDTARDLLRLTEAVEHWLIVCDEPLVHEDCEGRVRTACELPRNHYGVHDDQPPASLASRSATAPGSS